ncbi:MAG: head GIN domain-containing protein [Sphingomonas sp.]
MTNAIRLPRALLLAPLLGAALTTFASSPALAGAARRTYAVGSFERLRIDGPYEVRLETGNAPGASASGDARALDSLNVAVEGGTLIVRAGAGNWGEVHASTAIPIVVTLTTPSLRSVNLNGGGQLMIKRMVGQRLALLINGAGTLAATGIDADLFSATIIGNGTMTLAGRTGRARYQLSGAGNFAAGNMIANDLVAHSDGTGTMLVAARYTASLYASSLGPITVLGNAKCVVKAPPGTPIRCGKGAGKGN